MTACPTTAIFQSTEQALHVAFTILSQPAMSDNKFRRYLMQAIESQGSLSRANADWLAQLRGESSSTVNFGGLSQIEVRGQCAMIVASVNDRLPSRERGAILARYGAWPDKLKGFDLMVSTGGAMADFDIYAPAVMDLDGIVFALAARNYLSSAERKRLDVDLSLRALAARYGESKSSVHRTADWLKKTIQTLESRAVGLLDVVFKKHSVVCEIEH